jgi:hypothetical protein
LAAAAFPLFSQDAGGLSDGEQPAEPYRNAEEPPQALPGETAGALPLDALPADAVFVISKITFNIRGITRRDALMYNGEFCEGEVINGKDNFEKYIRDKTQILTNQRVLKDNVSTKYTLGAARDDGSIPVDLLIHIEDSWNIIALPKPNLDKNSGFKLTINARDYNFLGTMNPLRLDLGYEYDENSRSSFLIDIDSDTPFRAFGFNWNINFDHSFHYRPDVEETFYYKNVTGLSMKLPVRTTTFTFGFDESLVLNEENADRYKLAGYGDFQKGLYMSSNLYTIWEIPTGLNIGEYGEYGELTYTPSISFTFNHEFPRWPLADFRLGPSMSFNHNIGFGRINWISNYRKGMDVSLSNSYGYNFHRMDKGTEALSISYSLDGIAHFIISDFFGISTRLNFRHWFYHDPDYYEAAGDRLRGILDKDIHANYMLSLNFDFPVRILQFMPSGWFSRPKLRVFDFEAQLSPVLDMALYHDPGDTGAFGSKNILAAGGVELFVFPAFFRAVYLRASIGWNLKAIVKNPSGDTFKNFEYFLGLGHYY